MESIGNAINWVKDAAIRAADWVKAHNWLTLGIIVALIVAAIIL